MKALIYGSGQLAQMMYLAGIPLGIEVQAVDVNQRTVVHPVSKTPLSISLTDAIAAADVLSAEFDHVPDDLLDEAHASGKLYPSKQAISIGADRVKEKALLDSLAIPNVEYAIIRNTQDLHQGINALGSQIILKASRDGYDGYGQWRVESQDDLSNILPELEKLDLQAVPLIAEKFVPFQREISLIGVRNQNGEVKVYPMAENLHHKGQLHLSVAPANALTADLQTQAQEAFEKISTKLNYVGVLAIEFFQLDDRLLVNELAPRVHNSGHWTQQGSPTSQFENHLRAICGLPLGETHCVAPTAMINLIGYLPSTKDILSQPNCHLHLYGKTIRPKRKVGHVNVSGEKKSLLVQKMNELAKKLPNEHFPVLLDGINMQKQG